MNAQTADQTSEMTVSSPFGPLCLVENQDAIVALFWRAARNSRETPLLHKAATQLKDYFGGFRTSFDLPLRPAGNEFQRSVCRAMLDIPYGQTTTYGALAKTLKTSAQPVGQACGANSIPIIIPCHRVLGSDGLGGYSGDGGIERKIELLKHEGGFPYLL